jgi:hypothetical protein
MDVFGLNLKVAIFEAPWAPTYVSVVVNVISEVEIIPGIKLIG